MGKQIKKKNRIKKNRTGYKYKRIFLLKEVVLASLAVASVGVVLFDLVNPPTEAQHRTIVQVDFAVACVFLIDFSLELLFVKNRKKYFSRNWYLLLASIPLTYEATEALRGLRALRLVRILRAWEHLDFGLKINK